MNLFVVVKCRIIKITSEDTLIYVNPITMTLLVRRSTAVVI